MKRNRLRLLRALNITPAGGNLMSLIHNSLRARSRSVRPFAFFRSREVAMIVSCTKEFVKRTPH